MKLECFYQPLKGLSVLAFLIGTTVPNLTSADSSTINCIRNGTLLDWVPFLTGVLQDHSPRRRPQYHINRLFRKTYSFSSLAFQPCIQGRTDFCRVDLITSNYYQALPNLSQHPDLPEIYQEGYLLFQYVYNGIFHMSRLSTIAEHEPHRTRYAHHTGPFHMKRKLCEFNNATVMILKDFVSGIKDCKVCFSANIHHKGRDFAPVAVLASHMDISYQSLFFDAFIHWAQQLAYAYSNKLAEFLVRST